MLPGLPGSQFNDRSEIVRRLVDDCFLVLAPEYIGTYGSQGNFTFDNAVDTVLRLVDATAKNQEFYDVWEAKGFRLFSAMNVSKTKFSKENFRKRIFLLGGSFGACVALVSTSKSDLLDRVVAISTKASWRNTQKENRDLLRVIEEGYLYIYRLDASSKRRFERGSIDLNPIEYAKLLSKKSVLLIHGTADTVISSKESVKLYDRISLDRPKQLNRHNHQIILLEGVGHSGGSLAGEEGVYRRIREWLVEGGMK